MSEKLWEEFIVNPFSYWRSSGSPVDVSVSNVNGCFVKVKVYVIIPEKPELCDDLDLTG